MTEFQPKKRVIDLSGQLHRFRQAYYCCYSQIEDEEYDQLKEELQKLEFDFPQLILEDSPLIRVHAKPQESFPTRTHRCLLYTSPSPRDKRQSRMPSSA